MLTRYNFRAAHDQEMLHKIYNVEPVAPFIEIPCGVICVRIGWKNQSLVITICHHLASLVMPNGYHQHGFFNPTLTLMMDSYNLDHRHK